MPIYWMQAIGLRNRTHTEAEQRKGRLNRLQSVVREKQQQLDRCVHIHLS